MTPTDFKDLMAAVQSLAVALAVIIGGIWSLFTFNALAVRPRALAEAADLEARAERHAVGNMSVTATQLTLPGTPDICLRIDVTVENVRNFDLTLHFDSDPIVVTECLVWDHSAGRCPYRS